MFDFNASLNDVAPVAPVKLPVVVIQHENRETVFILNSVKWVFAISDSSNLLLCIERCSSKDKLSQSSIRP